MPKLPMEVGAFTAHADLFVLMHQNCESLKKHLSTNELRKLFAESSLEQQTAIIELQSENLQLQDKVEELKKANEVWHKMHCEALVQNGLQAVRIDALSSALAPFVLHKKALARKFAWKDDLSIRVYSCEASELRWGAFLQAEDAVKGRFFIPEIREDAQTGEVKIFQERDINRIEPMMNKLAKLWKKHPQERLTQIIHNYLTDDSDYTSFFYQEDEVTDANITRELYRE